MAQSLVGEDGHGVAEIQAAGLQPHGQTDAALPVGRAEPLRQPRRLLAEEEPTVRREAGLRIVLRGLGGGQPQFLPRLRVLGKEVRQALVVLYNPARFTARSEISKPSGRIRCRRLPVAAQVRAILPQFWGISGSTNTIFSMEPLPPFPPLRAHRFIDSCIVMQSAKKCNYNLQNPHIFS